MHHYIKDYKTTISALVTTASLYVTMFPDDFAGHPVVGHIAKFAALGGLAALGLTARDSHPDAPSGPQKVVSIDRPSSFPPPPSDLPPAA